MIFFTCMKETCERVKTYMQDTLSFRNTTESYRNEALSLRNDAQNAKNGAETAETRAEAAANRAESVVIPTEATYNEATIDNMFDNLLQDIVYNQLQISINKKGVIYG